MGGKKAYRAFQFWQVKIYGHGGGGKSASDPPQTRSTRLPINAAGEEVEAPFKTPFEHGYLNKILQQNYICLPPSKKNGIKRRSLSRGEWPLEEQEVGGGVVFVHAHFSDKNIFHLTTKLPFF